MSGRIRSIKPEILDDEKTAALSHLEWRLFVSVWLIADDYGNFRGDPVYVMGAVLWAAGESRDAVAKALESLARVSLLAPYFVRGQSYYHIPGWSKHQRVDKPGKPRMPGPEESDTECSQHVGYDSGEPSETFAESSREPRESLVPDLRPRPPTRTSDLENRAAELAVVAIGEINRLAGTAYDPAAESATKLCRGLVRSKRATDDVLLVIRSKVKWLTDEKMREFFRPKTLLGPDNFATYLDEARAGPGRAPTNGRAQRFASTKTDDEPDLSSYPKAT